VQVTSFLVIKNLGEPNLGKENLPIDWIISRDKVSALGLTKDSRILDVGSKDGKKAQYVAANVQLVMSDISKRPLSPFVCCDATKLPFIDNSFDAVTMLHVLEHIEDSGLAVKEIYRVLKKGGSTVIVTPNANRPTKVYSHIVKVAKHSSSKYPMNPDHVFEYGASDIEKVFAESEFNSYVIEPIFRRISTVVRIRQYCDQWIVTAKK
jgi:ubiquinone/menaquinone biosynthesis C-methylase UbiE